MKVVYPVRKRGKEASRYVNLELCTGYTHRKLHNTCASLYWLFIDMNADEFWCPK